MKKIKTCRNSDILVLLMAVGIILVLLAVMAAGGFLTAYQSWKRLQYLRDHPEER